MESMIEIKHFPQAYKYFCTPYENNDFSKTVREYSKVLQQRIDRTCLHTQSIPSKVILVGDLAVGKTSLIQKFCRDFFSRTHKSTIGVEFSVEKFFILDVPFRLIIWDTTGDEKLKTMNSEYYHDAHAVILVFDVTNSTSLYNCSKWLKNTLDKNRKKLPLIFLVGTKIDLISSSELLEKREEEAAEVANRLGAELWTVSSNTGDQPKKLFTRVAAMAFDKCAEAMYEEEEKKKPERPEEKKITWKHIFCCFLPWINVQHDEKEADYAYGIKMVSNTETKTEKT